MSDTANEQVLAIMMKQASILSADQQLRLAAYLVEQARTSVASSQSLRKWRDVRGLYSYPMLGEEAQEWVSRTRREGDEH